MNCCSQTTASSPSSKRGRYLCLTLLVVWVAFLSSAFAQQTCPPNCAIPTSHGAAVSVWGRERQALDGLVAEVKKQ